MMTEVKAGMEAHFCQCDGEKKDPVSHYKEKLSQIYELVSQNNSQYFDLGGNGLP